MTDGQNERVEVSRAIAADRPTIFAVLRDPKGQVAIDGSGMLMATSGSPVSAVGDTFVMHMDRDALRDIDMGEYDVTVKILTYDQDREIAWTVGRSAEEAFGHVYGYRLEDLPDGTLVTEYVDWSGIPDEFKARVSFPVVPESALRATLGILARTVAPGAHRPT
jgi:hypothetical protein